MQLGSRVRSSRAERWRRQKLGAWGVCIPGGSGTTQGLPSRSHVEPGLGPLPGPGAEALQGRGERRKTTPQNARVSLQFGQAGSS